MERNQFDITDFYRAVTCNDRNCVGNPPVKNEKCNDPLTMVFINMQPLDEVYMPKEAFCNGTLFPNLNKPFLGGRRR